MAEAWPSDSAGRTSLQATTERTHDNTYRFPQRHHTSGKSHTANRQIRFAHPAEAVVAELLGSFGVRWLYEPVTFPLITSATGEPVQCFTPDFFLPDHDVYIEMTTMRQSLVTRKNRKFRLMREIYPHVDVRLLYRKDVELIVDRYGIGEPADLQPGPVFATSDQIAHKAAGNCHPIDHRGRANHSDCAGRWRGAVSRYRRGCSGGQRCIRLSNRSGDQSNVPGFPRRMGVWRSG